MAKYNSPKGIAAAIVATLILPQIPTAALAAPSTQRLAGGDRFATAAQVSQYGFPDGSVPVVYVTTGTNFPDALGAGPAAKQEGGPVLLVTSDVIPSTTAMELKRLTPANIKIVGGASAVSSAVERELQQYTSGSVARIQGPDRYATAAAASANFPTGVVVYIATGLGFADALSGGAAAAARGGPILLVTPSSIPSSTADRLQSLQPSSIKILGGTNAVSSAVEEQLRRYTSGSVDRFSGLNRFDTSVAVSAAAFPGQATTVFLATGEAFADALSGGSVAGKLNAPLLLTRKTCMPEVVHSEIMRLAPSNVVVLGGQGAVSDSGAGKLSCEGQYLIDLEAVSERATVERGPARVNGTQYERSYSYAFNNCTDCTYTSDFDLGRDYTRFKAVLGMRDDTERREGTRIDGAATFEILVDGVSAYSATLSLGQEAPVDIEVQGKLRLTVKVSQGTNFEIASFGDARLIK